MKIFSAVARRPVVSVFVVVIAGLLAIVALPQLRWRAQVAFMHVAGQIPDIEMKETLAYMLPGSDQSMARLIETRNPHAVIRNAKTSAADIESGSAVYRERCASCHGPDGAGGPAAPALIGRTFNHGESDWAVYRTIRDGVANTAMQPTAMLAENQRWQVISFLRYIDVPHNADQLASTATAGKNLNVPYEELEALDRPAADWLTYSGSYSSIRHSALSQVDVTNVNRLAVKWIHQFPNQPALEVSPLVRDGVMFVSAPPCTVSALSAVTGQAIWTWTCSLLNTASSEIGGTVNRGVALLGDKIFVTTWDARLFALDARTGKQLWKATVADDYNVYYISAAPLAYRDMVVTGVATRAVGQGFVAAFDVETGKERWRRSAIPGPEEAGHETWAGDSWRVGGAPTWLTGSYDPKEDLLYWGVGNPKPDYDAGVRAGDNLYTNSVIALRGTTGKLVWHFQFTPADNKDWDANQIPVLIDHTSGGTTEKRILWANRNGFYYVLDRLSGKFLSGTAFVQQNWNAGLDANGRPIDLAPGVSGGEGQLLYPGNVGGTSWWSPTYFPDRDLMIVPVLEQGMVFFPSFSSPPRAAGRSFYSAIRALDSSTGKLVWEYRRPPRFVDNTIAGTLSTAGRLVFGSDQSTFFALNADTGALLWSVETGGTVMAAPITYAVDGQQFVSIAAGGDLLSFVLPQ